MPSRRALLGTVTSGTLLGVAGCLGSGGDTADGTATDTPSPSETTSGPPAETTAALPTAEETVTVGPDRFRCNASATDVRVRPDAVESGTISTAAACPTTTTGGSS